MDNTTVIDGITCYIPSFDLIFSKAMTKSKSLKKGTGLKQIFSDFRNCLIYKNNSNIAHFSEKSNKTLYKCEKIFRFPKPDSGYERFALQGRQSICAMLSACRTEISFRMFKKY